MEATLLLVNPTELPRGLEDQLTAKGAFVETATTEQLEPAVIAVAPDLVVAPSTSELDHVLAVMGRQEPLTPVVLVADWKEHRELRARRERVIGALLSRGTPAAVLATRIAEFGERAARGEALQRTPSLAPRAAASQARSATEPARAPDPRPERAAAAALSAAPAPAAPAPSVASPEVSPTASGAPAASATAPAAVLPPNPGVSTPLTTFLVNGQGEGPAPGESASPRRTSAAAEPTTARAAERTTPAAAERAATAERTTSAAAEGTATAGSAMAGSATAGSATAGSAMAGSAMAGSAMAGSAMAGSAMAERTSERLSLTFSQRPLPPLRLGLVDTDLTRAGAVADELRRRGVTTQLLSPDLDATRWHLLRRLSPHGLVIDEHGLAGQAEWLEALRLDPFLRHVPLLVVPLERIFREASGDADASLLVPLLLSLGAEEAALRDRIAPGREIELRLDQIGALRLLEVLGERTRPTRLECLEGDTRLRWELRNGRAHTAHLDARGEPGSGGSDVLPAEEALDWLLAHPECRIRATEPTEVGAPDDGIPVEELLSGATGREVIPAPPPPPRRSLRPPRPEPITSPAVSPGGALQHRLRSCVQGARGAWTTFRAWIVPRWRGLPPPRRYAALAVGALLLVAPLVAALTGGESPEPATATVHAAQPTDGGAAPPQLAAAPPSPAQNASSSPVQAPAPANTAPKPEEGEHLLFQVSPDTQLPPCDESVSVAGESRAMATRHLQRARKQLVAGNVEEARLLMCKAARLEPASPASAGLAQLYLTDRSLENAKHWAEVALRHDPESRTTVELLGDIASQRGDVAEARKLWLDTMQLTGDETAKLEAVSRSHTRAAQRAVRSSDLPRAERFFRRAVTLDPKNGPAAAGLAQVLFDLEQREAAERWARRAVEIDPTSLKHLGTDLRELVE